MQRSRSSSPRGNRPCCGSLSPIVPGSSLSKFASRPVCLGSPVCRASCSNQLPRYVRLQGGKHGITPGVRTMGFSMESEYGILRLLLMGKMTVFKLNRWRNFSFLLLAAVVLIADQVTKALVRAHMYLGQSVPSEGTFRLTYVTNPYGVFGFRGFWGIELGPSFFIVATSIVVLLIAWLFFTYPPMRGKWPSIGLGFLLGGAMGNLIDRVFLGAVTDFIDVALPEGFNWSRWPTFNIADAALTTGIFLLIIFLVIIARDPIQNDSSLTRTGEIDSPG